MAQPHYHRASQCLCDAPDGISGVPEAIGFYSERLAQLDKAISDASRSTVWRWRSVLAKMRTERDHLAALLRVLGVDVKELDEEKSVTRPSCTCARIDMAGAPGLHPGAHHYVPGRVDPNCPFHGEEKSTGE